MATADPEVAAALAQAERVVAPFIDSNPIALITKSYCPHSANVKRIFKEVVGPDGFAYMDIDLRPDTELIQEYMAVTTGAPTVPRSFISGQFVGGDDEISALYRSGQLRKIIEQVPVDVAAADEAP
ncbi:hypothetical protein WJX72_001512 [[Myrmecia] bisecta]|uniref:Glutaredoxin domain-containing protein n=1 Tax=[Myrmecia] bisecta TaxID=41462 RepID=A0AAW1PKX0_9CHLO